MFRGEFRAAWPRLLLAAAFAVFPLLARAGAANLVLDSFSFPISENQTITLQFDAVQAIMAMDEFGRQCALSSGELKRFDRDGMELWRLENATGGGGSCQNAMTFRIEAGRFRRVDHGFPEIFKYYATRSCEVFERKPEEFERLRYLGKTATSGLPLSADQTQMLADCFLKRDKWATVKAMQQLFAPTEAASPARREACTTHLLAHEDKTVFCTSAFKKLGDDSAFRDIVVLKEGRHVIRGGGSQAATYILHPDFQGEVDLAGHSTVYHLARQKCQSQDVFRGCKKIDLR